MMYLATCRARKVAFSNLLGCHAGSELFAYTLRVRLAVSHCMHGCVGRVDPEEKWHFLQPTIPGKMVDRMSGRRMAGLLV